MTQTDISDIILSPHHQHSFNTNQVPCYQSYTEHVVSRMRIFNRFCNRLYKTFLFFIKSPTAMGCRLLLKGMFVAEQKLNKSTYTFGRKLINSRTNFPRHSAVFRCVSIAQLFLLKGNVLNTKSVLSHASGSPQY